MNDSKIIGDFQPLCPQCGAKLLVEQFGDEPKPDDRVFCPIHGTIGTSEELARQAVEQNRDEIEQHLDKHVRKMLRDAGFNPD